MALANFLSDNGVTPCKDTIDRIVASWGKREQSAKKSAIDGNLNGVVPYNTFVKVTLNELCDIMKDANALDLYKYTFVPKSQRAKGENK